MKTPLITLLLTLVCTGLFSQSESKKTAFSLEEAKKYAIQNSYFTKSAMMDVAKAEQRVKEVRGIGLPKIDGNASYNYFLEIPKQLVPANTFNPAAGEDDFLEFQMGTKSNMKAGIQVSQLLFDGSYLVGLKASKTYRELAHAQKAKSEAQISRDISNAYGLALAVRENIAFVKASEQQLTKLSNENQALLDAGFIEEKDFDQVKLLLLQIKNMRIDAENQERTAIDMLKFTMGIPIKETITLTDDLNSVKEPALNKESNLNAKLVMENHVDFMSAAVNLRAKELTLSNEQMGNYPKLYGSFLYEGNSFGNNFNHFDSDGKWFPTSVLGVQLNIPIFAGGQRHYKIQQGKVGVNQAKLQLEQTEQSLLLELARNKNAYESSVNKLKNSEENLELSKKIKDQTHVKYKEGIASSVELTQAENQHTQSQLNYMAALIEVIQNKASLDYALGKK